MWRWRPLGTIGDMNRTEIEDTVRDMWSTRPVRHRGDRKIAGVAAAIARRYRIDPILVRIGFVVATIYGGAGVLVYLFGWLLLPEEGDEVSGGEALLGQGRSSMSRPLAIVLAIALVPASSGIFTGDLSAILALLGIAAALYLLHRNRPPIPAAGGVDPTMAFNPAMPVTMPATGPSVADPTSTDTAFAGATPQDVPGRQTPPAWDPLGVAPFAWDLPEPSPATAPPAPAPKRRRSAVTPVTLALALMVAGVGAIVAMTTGAIGPMEVAAATLAVVGTGLLVGSFVRGGRGLIAVAIPLAVATYAMSVISLNSFDGVGQRHWNAATAAEVQPLYKLSVGEATLDLSGLQLNDGDRVETEVRLSIGKLNVTLPQGAADIEVACAADRGQLDCLGELADGMRVAHASENLGADGKRGGGTIVLRTTVNTGQVTVTRG